MRKLEPTTETSREIVDRSGSNLAYALSVLPKEKREDMCVFYAFCRIVDDIADDPHLPALDKKEALGRWRKIARGQLEDHVAGVETEFEEIRLRYSLDESELVAIIDGVEMDTVPLRFDTAGELMHYCYRVASAVGLSSIRIFGYEDPATRDYAEHLGYALQWTNIMRDVGEDAREGRVYLPLDDLHRFGVKEENILSGKPDFASFQRLMKFEAGFARGFYKKAVEALPDVDRKSMRSAEMMRRIYTGILDAMEKDGFRVFDKRYKLSKARMLTEYARAKTIG